MKEHESNRNAIIPSIILVFFAVDIGLSTAYLLNYIIGEPFGILNKLVNLDGEDSVATWYSSIQLFCVFFLAAVYTSENIDRQNARSWMLIGFPLLFLALSIDESVQIHEWLGERSDALLPGGSRKDTIFKRSGIWMFVLGIPFICCFYIWFSSVKQYFKKDGTEYLRIVYGIVVFLIGVLGFEAISNFFSDETHSIGFILITCGEETLEMAGVTIILWGVYEMVCKKGFIRS